MRALPAGPTVCDRFLEQVWRAPDRIALVDGDREVTYGQLCAAAQDLAGELLERRIEPEQIVAIGAEPCAEMVVGLLAVLLAGAAYLPIDPRTPAHRVRLVLADAHAVAVLTTPGVDLAGVAPDATPIARLDDVSAPRPEVRGRASAANRAYVIYTSGSTGRPKGVEIEHRSLLSLIDRAGADFGMSPDDVVPLYHSFAFDVSVWEIWSALAYGGRLVIVRADRKDPASMVRVLRAHRITVLNQTPTAFSALLPALAALDLTELALRLVIFAGEAVIDENLRRCVSLNGSPGLINMYGITEVTVHATIQRVTPEVLTTRCPIGRPIPPMSVLVLDDHLEVAPVGAPGEIYVGGVQVARGYLGRPGLTAERFVPSPFSAGARLYRSGDTGRYRADGTIEYIGRIDQQVKIRGYRVEPREIESTLLRYPAVTEAVVVARGGEGDRRLIAYLVTELPRPDVGALRAYLGDLLPSYLIPSAFVFLDALPRTSNGKVDQRALPNSNERPRHLPSPVPPGSPRERVLCTLWAAVLQIDEIGIDDDFLELGGDSILAARLTSRAWQESLRFTLQDLFRHPTVRKLCGELDGVSGPPAEDRAEAVGEFALTPVQQHFLDPSMARDHPAIQSAVLHLDRRVDLERLRATLAAVLGHHDLLRSRFRIRERGSHGVIPSSADVDFGDVIRVVEVLDGRGPRGAAETLATSLDQRRGALVAAAVLRADGPASDRVVLVIDHLVVDLVSWYILIDDVVRAYEDLGSGVTPRLPPKTTAFPHWARVAVDHGESDALLEELPYWSAVARQVASVRRLGRGEAQARSRRITRKLPRDATTRLLRATASLGPPNEVVLAALARAWAAVVGGDTVCIDLESHGRDGIPDAGDLSRTVGCFTAVFPAVIDVPADGSMPAQVQGVGKHLKSVPAGGVGFGLLHDRGLLGSGAGAVRSEVCFNFLGRVDANGWHPMLLSFDDESLNRPPQLSLGYPLEVTAGIVDGELVADFDHGPAVEPETARQIAAGVVEALAQLSADATAAPCPATNLQQALVFQCVANPGVGMYLAQSRLELTGSLDADLLREAIEFVVARHDILRTRLDWQSGTTPLQIVTPKVAVPFTYHDWSAWTPAASEAACAERLRQDRLADMDLATGPLLRFTCVRTGEDVHTLLVTAHHALLDGWSFALMVSEIVLAYRSMAGHERPRLGEAPQFRDYVEWLATRDYGRAEQIWRDELRGATPRRLSTTWTSYAEKSGADVGERHDLLDPASTSALRDFGVAHRLTASTILQSAWGLVLAQVYGAGDVVFGTVSAVRPPELPDAERMLGLLVETTPVRVRIDPDREILDWLRFEQERQLGLREYSYASLQRIYSWLRVSPDDELFDTLFTYRNFPSPLSGDAAGPSLGARVVEPPFTRRTGYAVVAAPKPGRELDLAIFYEREHVSEALADEIIGHYGRVVRSIVADPRRALGCF